MIRSGVAAMALMAAVLVPAVGNMPGSAPPEAGAFVISPSRALGDFLLDIKPSIQWTRCQQVQFGMEYAEALGDLLSDEARFSLERAAAECPPQAIGGAY